MGEKALFPVKWFLPLRARFRFHPCNRAVIGSSSADILFYVASWNEKKSTWLVEEQIFFYLSSWNGFTRPVDQIERTRGVRAGRTCLGINHRGAQKEVGSNFRCFQLLPLFTTYYCSHAITNLPLSKATGRNRSSSSTQRGTEGVKVTQFCLSWWVFLFSSSSSFPQKNTHIIFTLGVSASLVLLLRQLPGCKPALQNQILPFILGFAFIILAWISFFFISYYFMSCLFFFLFFVSFVCFLSFTVW